MKIGDKIPVVLQVKRPVYHGETLFINGEAMEILNPRGNKYLAAPIGCDKGPFYLVCEDGETECGQIKRRAMVDLIECGLC